MAAGTLVIGGRASGLPGAVQFGPYTIIGTATIGEQLSVALASGDNTFTVPTGAVAVAVATPSGNTVAVKYRTSSNSGDGGLPINPGGPSVHNFAATAPTSVILNAASSISTLTYIYFL